MQETISDDEMHTRKFPRDILVKKQIPEGSPGAQVAQELQDCFTSLQVIYLTYLHVYFIGSLKTTA